MHSFSLPFQKGYLDLRTALRKSRSHRPPVRIWGHVVRHVVDRLSLRPPQTKRDEWGPSEATGSVEEYRGLLGLVRVPRLRWVGSLGTLDFLVAPTTPRSGSCGNHKMATVLSLGA